MRVHVHSCGRVLRFDLNERKKIVLREIRVSRACGRDVASVKDDRGDNAIRNVRYSIHLHRITSYACPLRDRDLSELLSRL